MSLAEELNEAKNQQKN